VEVRSEIMPVKLISGSPNGTNRLTAFIEL
jgi:hypothetical protein